VQGRTFSSFRHPSFATDEALASFLTSGGKSIENCIASLFREEFRAWEKEFPDEVFGMLDQIYNLAGSRDLAILSFSASSYVGIFMLC
jgi:hypothetical protein